MSPKISEDKRRLQIDRILEAAISCFSRQGYHPTTVDDIADEAALSKGAIYTYFESKEQIFLTLADQALEKKIALLSQVYSPNSTPWTRLCNVWHQIIMSWARVDLENLRVVFEFWMEASKHPHLREVLENRYAKSEQIFVNILEEGIKTGEFSPKVDAKMLARVFWSLTDGLVGFWLARGQHPGPEELRQLEYTIQAILPGAVGYDPSIPQRLKGKDS